MQVLESYLLGIKHSSAIYLVYDFGQKLIHPSSSFLISDVGTSCITNNKVSYELNGYKEFITKFNT